MLAHYPQILIPDLEQNDSVFDLLGSSKFDVLQAAARTAYADSPSISDLVSYLSSADSLKYSYDPDIQFLVNQGYFEKKKLSKEEFTEKYATSGLEYDSNMTDESVQDIIERKKQREINEYIISRGKGGIVEAVGKFGVEVVAGNLSPINIAASFIPIGGQAWWAAKALKYGKFKTGLAKGFIGGSIGQAAIEPFISKQRKFEQREYELKDSAINILGSGLFGSTLHGLGYGAKYLKDKYYISPGKLSPEFTIGHSIVDNQFKANLESVLQESYPHSNQTSGQRLESLHFLSLEQLQAAKLELVIKAEQQFPLYFKKQRKVLELEQYLHEQFYTKNNEDNIPSYLKDHLLAERTKFEDLHQKQLGIAEFQEYLGKTRELDRQIVNNLRKQQFEVKGYDLSMEDLYIARSQLDDGKHINLDEPSNAESFYHNADEITNTAAIPDLPEHLSSLESDLSTLPESMQTTYNQEVITQDELSRLAQDILIKIKQGAKTQDLTQDFKTLSLIDGELADKLKVLHKEYSGNLQLVSLEKNKKIDEFFSDFKEKNFLKKRDHALNLIKQAQSEEFVRHHANKVKGIDEYLRQVDLRQETVSRELLFGLIRDLEQVSLVREFSDIAYESDIIQELWNITHPSKIPTGSKKAKQVAEIIHKRQTIAINRANLAGAYITPLEGYITRQTHNSAKLRQVGFEGWLEFIYPLLDYNRTGKVDLKGVFNNLATNTHLKETDEYLNLSFSKNRGVNIAELVSASRKLHFKSAESWLKYQKEFGYYSSPNIVDAILKPLVTPQSFIADSITGNLGMLGKSIGILETMGSNPESMLAHLQTTFIKELQEKVGVGMANSNLFSEFVSLKRTSKFNNRLELMLGVTPEIPQVEAILSSYRSLKCMSNLGSTVISSFPDAATFVSELQNNGIPILESYASLIKVATSAFYAKEKKEFGQLLGIGVDSLLGGSYSRIAAEQPVVGNIAKTTNAFFKLNCMNWWDNSWKSTMGNLLSHNLAVQVDKPFKSLYQGLQNLLTRYGIDEHNWYLYKNLIQTVGGNQYLIPDSSLLPDNLLQKYLQAQGKNINSLNIARLRQDLTNNLRRYLLDRVDTAIPTPHTAERAAMQLANLGIKPGSPLAQVVQCIMQFKTFAYSYMVRLLKSITIDQIPIHEQRGVGLFDIGTWKDIAKSMQNPITLKILPQLLLGTTSLGYLSINALRLLRGQELLKPNEEGVFTASLLKGGGLGLYGDFIFGEYDRYNHNLLESLSGPIGGDVIDIGKIYSKALKGEIDKTEDLTKSLLKRNIPGRNLFYLQPALFMIQ